MRIAYLGSGEVGLPTLRALAGSPHQVVLVATQPDRPAGRGLKVRPGPVKEWALAAGVPVIQPEDINTPESIDALRASGAEVLLVIAFGQYLRKAVRECVPHGAINFHPSLLPRHRGAAPFQFTILSGDRDAGVTVIRLEKRMDAGAMLGRLATPVGPEETAGELQDRLAEMGAPLVLRVLDELAAGTAADTAQDEAAATHTAKLTPESGRIDWSRPAAELDCLIRGLSPRPGAVCRFEKSPGKTEAVKLLRSRLGSATAEGKPAGEVVGIDPTGITVAAGDGGTVILRELQPENSRVMSAADFVNGRRLRAGMRFDNGA
jgi:methionyl-tRNA formyltransferase